MDGKNLRPNRTLHGTPEVMAKENAAGNAKRERCRERQNLRPKRMPQRRSRAMAKRT